MWNSDRKCDGDRLFGRRSAVTEKMIHRVMNNTIQNQKSHAINTIWGSQVLHISEVGYLPFYQGTRYDHKLILIKLSNKSAFDNIFPPSRSPSDWKLRLHHPIWGESLHPSSSTLHVNTTQKYRTYLDHPSICLCNKLI